MKPIEITILDIFELTVGTVYSVQFPANVFPQSGQRFLHRGTHWKITAIATSKRKDDVWDCRIVSDTNSSDRLKVGTLQIQLENSNSN
jgi:hypothetical protein